MAAYNYSTIHKYKKSKKVYKRKGFWYFFLILAFLALFFYIFFYISFFQIKNIEISGNSRVLTADIRAAAEGKLNGKMMFLPQSNILSFPQNALQNELQKKFSALKSVNIERKFPNRIIIRALERDPVGLWCQSREIPENASPETIKDFSSFLHQLDFSEPNFNCFYLDQDGIIFESATSSDFIIRSPQKEIKVGSRVLASLLVAKIGEMRSKLLSKTNISAVQAFVFSETQVNFQTNEGWWIYFNPKKDIDWQITSLDLVLANKVPATHRPNLKYIDLRFEGISIYPSVPKK